MGVSERRVGYFYPARHALLTNWLRVGAHTAVFQALKDAVGPVEDVAIGRAATIGSLGSASRSLSGAVSCR